MAIKMVREPSETPNINNIDDIVPMRYAYGNQNGYVIGKGTEISNTVNGLNFTVNSGQLVLQGVECDIDAVGVTITIDNIATTRYYVVYLQVNLGTNTASILNTYDTATYPSIDEGDDLTENTTGIARLPLYRFIATSGVISEVNKVVESIKYINKDFITNVKVNNANNSDNSIKINSTNNYTGLTKYFQENKIYIDNEYISIDNNQFIEVWKTVFWFSRGLSIGDTITFPQDIQPGARFRFDCNGSSLTQQMYVLPGTYYASYSSSAAFSVADIDFVRTLITNDYRISSYKITFSKSGSNTLYVKSIKRITIDLTTFEKETLDFSSISVSNFCISQDDYG